MKISLTLSRYIAKQFFLSIGVILLGLMALVLLVDIIELVRRTSGEAGISFFTVLQMALLKTPSMAEKILPFAVLIGSMATLFRLTRSQELVVTRASGVSVWQFLLPALAVVFCMACLFIAVFNPLSAVMLLKFEQMEAKHITGRSSLMSVSPSGLWLRQMEEGAEYIIHARRLSQADMMLAEVMILSFDELGRFTERFDAKRATLMDGRLELAEVIRSVPTEPTQTMSSYTMPTGLQMAQIQDSFASPETIPFWSLPSFIDLLDEAGFSALRHKIYWHTLLASPLLLVSMVLLAAVFSLRMPRKGRLVLLAVGGLASGFSLHFMTDIVHALGAAGNLPIWLAAWTPALIISALAASALLHLEDG